MQTGPNHWADMEGSFCGDSSQSPIDIVPEDAVYSEFEEFMMEGYDLENNGGSPTRLDNNGHTGEDFRPTSGDMPVHAYLSTNIESLENGKTI